MQYRPSEDVVFCPVEAGAVLLHSGQEVYFGLNPVGAFIWQQLPPVTGSLDEIVALLKAKYADVDVQLLRADMLELLGTLERNGLVVAADG